jgi:hypothetical protein
VAVFEAERGNHNSVLGLRSHTFAFSDVLKGDGLEIGSGVNEVKATSSPLSSWSSSYPEQARPRALSLPD